MNVEPTAPPPRIRLDRRDARLILIAVVIAAASLWVALRYFHLAFPEASIDFRVTDAQAAGIARAFLAGRGLHTAGWRHASRFNYDDDAKVFLERELGLARTAGVLRTRVHLWRWQQRWFQPLVREEMRVDVTPAGQVVGFDHPIAEAAPGARLAPAAAQALAERFLTQSMGLNLDQLSLVGSSRLERPNRSDYLFTWRDRAPLASGPNLPPEVAAAEYRREVRVQGDAIGAYREFLHVPDTWLRGYRQLRSQNDAAGRIDAALIVLLGLALLAALFDRLRRGDVRWRVAAWVGGAGAVLSFLAALNGLSQDRFAYATTQSYSAFFTRALLSAVLDAFAVGVFLAVLTAAAEPLYRRRFLAQPLLSSFLSWRGVRSKVFLRSVILGIMLAFFFFAYQTVFYLIANHLGAWAPADVPYDALLNTRFPWIFVLLGGFFPAIFEEFMFRMGAIPLFEGWLARRGDARGGGLSFRSWTLWIAVVAAAFIWGFGHSTYPNEPFFIRGVEVGIGGVVLGWIMVRFGILTTVVWHYTVDALYTALLLLRSPNAYFRVSGGVTALIFALPLLIALGAYLITGTFSDLRGLRNEDAPAPPSLPAAPALPPAPPPPYRRRRARAWIVGFAVAAALLAAYLKPLASWRSGLRFTSTPAQATAAARAYLAAQGISTAGYRTVATVDSAQSGPAAHFIFVHAGRAAVVREYSQVLAGLFWRVRFFRPLQQDEFEVAVRPDGRAIFGYSRQVPDQAAGASPTLAAAQAAAARYLRQVGEDVGRMRLQSATQQVQPHRVDSNFIWEDPPGSPRNIAFPGGGIRFRIAARMIGDEFGGFAPSLHVPEASVRAYERTTLPGVLLRLAPTLLYAGLTVLVLWFLFRFVRERGARWRPILLWAVAGGLAIAVAVANRLPAAAAQYSTDTPWNLWQVALAVQLIFAFLGGFLATVVLFPAAQLTAPRALALAQPAARRLWARDALLAGILALLWSAGWQRCELLLNAVCHRFGTIVLASVHGLDVAVPGLSTLVLAPFQSLWAAALLGIIVPAFVLGWRDRRWRPWLFVALAVLCLGTLPPVHTTAQLGLGLALTAAEWALVGLFIGFFLRDNPLAYVSTGLLLGLVPAGLGYLGAGAARYHAAGVVLLAVAAAWLVWLAAQARAGVPEPAAIPAARDCG